MNHLEKLGPEMNESYSQMLHQWHESAPSTMEEQAGWIAAARQIVQSLAGTITETDAAFLLRYDDPLQALTEIWMEEHSVKSFPNDLVRCIRGLSAVIQEETQQITVRDLLTQYPSASFDMMTPGGYVFLTPEQARGLLAGESTFGNPGCSGCDMEIPADELLTQKIQSMNLEKGVWHLLSDYPQIEQGMTMQ